MSREPELAVVLLPRADAFVFDLNVFECRNALTAGKKEAIAAQARHADVVTLQEDVESCGPLVFRDHRLVAYSVAGRLRNSIFVHRSVAVSGPCGRQELCISDDDVAEERCAAAIVLRAATGRHVTLATTHLVGGRYDDAHAARLRRAREAQLRRLTEMVDPDVIVGDYNSFPDELYVRYERRILAYAHRIGVSDAQVWREYATSGHAFLAHEGFVRAKYDGEQFAQTNARGNTIVDWIYFRPGRAEVLDPRIVGMFDESHPAAEDAENPNMLSDHHAITFRLRPVEAE